jgi:hypothetical protein
MAYTVTVKGAEAVCTTAGTIKAVCDTPNYSGGKTALGASIFIVQDGKNSCVFEGRPEGLAGPKDCSIPVRQGNIVNQSGTGPITVTLP